MARAINPAKRRQIFAVLEETARSVQHLHEPALRKIIPILRHAQFELEKDLGSWLSRENGEATFTAQRYRNALTAVRHAMATAHRMAPAIEDALWESADVAGRLSTSNVVRELERFAHIFEGSIHPVSIDAAAIIAEGDKVLFKQFASSARTYAGSIGENLIQELAVSRVKSESIFELTNRLQKRMPHLFQSDRWGAERLARTECLTGETVVDAAVVRAAFRRWYQGPVVEIVTNDGRHFATTPNHPMLTVRGWLAAHDVQHGDHLVCRGGKQGAGAPGNEHVAARPAPIGEIFDALSAVRIRERRGTRQPDFHGDGMDGEVEVARANGHLRIGSFAPLYQPLAQEVFSPSDFARATFCDRCDRLLSMQGQVCLCSMAHGHAHLGETPGYQLGSDPQISRDVYAGLAGLIPNPDLFAGDVRAPSAGLLSACEGESFGISPAPRHPGGCNLLVDPGSAVPHPGGDLRRAEAREIQFDRVSSVRIRNDFAGHVYNLATPFGYFNINGAYTGNTINAYNEYHVEGIKQIAEEDPEILARWDASFDWRRCPMCGSLDGQVRDVANGEKFVADWFTKRKGGARHHRLTIANAPAHPCCRCCLTPWRLSWGMVARATSTPAAPAAVIPLPMAARPRA